MISPPKNRVQEIKSKFENLGTENAPVIKKVDRVHLLNKHTEFVSPKTEKENLINNHQYVLSTNKDNFGNESDSSDECPPKPNASYLYGKNDLKISLSDSKTSLSRQTSDPGKKLHRSHAFRCDKSQKIVHSPKRHDSCNGRSETSDYSLKMDKKLSDDRLKLLGNFLEEHMKKENFVPRVGKTEIVGKVCEVHSSIPDSEVPKHILDQYAIVTKPKKRETEKQESMTDSGVCSETENNEEDKHGRLKRLLSQFEKPTDHTNLKSMYELCDSSETIRLERKNPHLILTDTLKKALKQPLPPGPPPKKPPRVFVAIPEDIEFQKKEAKRKLEKLEKLLQKRNDVQPTTPPETAPKKPKEMHYLCTEILDITNRTLQPRQHNDPISRCLNSLSCAVTSNSTSSLPYTRMMSEPNSTRNSIKMCCSCSNDSLQTQQQTDKCLKCQYNDGKHDRFKCHLKCKCRRSEFYVTDEHIYDVPSTEGDCLVTNKIGRRSKYGTLNNLKVSKSLEDLRPISTEDQIYDIAYEPYRPIRMLTPEPTSPQKTDFQNIRRNFENGSPQKADSEVVAQLETDYENVPPLKHDLEGVQSKTDFETVSKSDLENGPQVKSDLENGPQLKSDFEKLRQNFENGSARNSLEDAKKVLKPILISKIRDGKSTESLSEGFISAKKTMERRFATEVKKRSKGDGRITFSLPKRDTQLDLDKENLNCLMNEIYDTVTAVCNMDDNKPGSFPTDHSDGSTSEESVKLTRSLTEKRKNYVRRVSTRVAYLDPKSIKTARFRHQTSICSYKSEIIDNPYSTYRSWKSFRTSQGNISKMETSDSKNNLTDSKFNVFSKGSMAVSTDTIDNMSIDEKAGCLDIKLPFEPREKGLFNLCVLVGLDYMNGKAYVKSVFPSQVQVPPHIENLVFPETMSDAPKSEWAVDAQSQQCYSIVLTDERGERSYGYCRRVLPEGATTCLPLLYCLIGRYRAPGFYYKVLEEIESHHGISDVEIHSLLQQLFETDFPDPGQEITIQYQGHLDTPPCDRSKTLPDMRRPEVVAEGVDGSSEANLYDYCNVDNNNRLAFLADCRMKTIKRSIDPRADEDSLSVLLDLLGAGLVIKVFGSLLLERKVIVVGDKLRAVSWCVEALQSVLYPLVWQHTLISSIPHELRHDLLDAPLPILAGMLHAPDQLDDHHFDEGMLIDLTHPSKVLSCHGDESTILPTSSFKTLKTSLKMETGRFRDKSEDTKMRNVMISEAFMRFFVDILGDFWGFFRVGRREGEDALGKGDVVFDKEAFIKNTSSKENQCFLEWFTETAMFNHFIQNMAETHRHRSNQPSNQPKLVDTPLPDFYELFHERVRCRTNISSKNLDSSKNNYKNAVNKKVKFLKSKLRDFIA